MAWLKEWRTCPSYTIAGVQELYQQLLPTKLYYHEKTLSRIKPNQDVLCRMCGRNPESIPHILSGCSSLAEVKLYQSRRFQALKILFCELLKKDLKLVSHVSPWYSSVQPKPLYMYENRSVKTFWDVAVFAENGRTCVNDIFAPAECTTKPKPKTNPNPKRFLRRACWRKGRQETHAESCSVAQFEHCSVF